MIFHKLIKIFSIDKKHSNSYFVYSITQALFSSCSTTQYIDTKKNKNLIKYEQHCRIYDHSDYRLIDWSEQKFNIIHRNNKSDTGTLRLCVIFETIYYCLGKFYYYFENQFILAQYK